mgnify:CR=1 FL=1
MKTLITDRVELDVIEAKENPSATDYKKGNYNFTDLNRLEEWCSYLQKKFNDNGYKLNLNLKLKYYTYEELKKFTYEIRDSSKSFCNNLIEKGLNKITNKNKISEKIKTQVWYLLDWNMDPTIKAMLIMLDEIEQRLNDSKIQRENIINSTIENEKIYFYSIEINDFGSADDIYI